MSFLQSYLSDADNDSRCIVQETAKILPEIASNVDGLILLINPKVQDDELAFIKSFLK